MALVQSFVEDAFAAFRSLNAASRRFGGEGRNMDQKNIKQIYIMLALFVIGTFILHLWYDAPM